MLDKMLFSNNGAFVGIAPVGVAYLSANSSKNTAIWEKLYTGIAVGDILKETLNMNSILENRKYNLFGDPTIILKYDTFTEVNPNPTLPMEFTL